MNKKLFLYGLLLVTGSLFISCQDRLEREFQNPEKHNPKPEQIIPGMLTQMLNTRFFVLDYGEWWWTDAGGFGITAYAQIAVRRPHPSEAGYWDVWHLLDGSGEFYSDMRPALRFNWYYTDLKNWGLIRDEIETLSGANLDDNEIFFLAATVIKNTVGLQQVDVFNFMPYTEAFQGTKGVFFPKYDNPKDIYTSALDELAELAVKIPEAYNKMSQKAKDSFKKQDIAFGGDPQKWAQYANAVRLRHAVRISGVDADFAKKHITAVLPNLPKVDFIWPNTQRNENRVGGEGGGIYARAIYERSTSMLIPNIIMQRMNYGTIDYEEGEDDPRLPVIACPTRYTIDNPNNYQFTGCSMDYDSQYPYWPTQTPPAGVPYIDNGPGITVRTFVNTPTDINLWLRSCYSQYNLATFAFGNIPSYMNSLAENDLFFAEIAAKGLANTGKSAAEHIKDAVIHSTDFWYTVNSLTNIWQTQNMPAKNDFLTKAFQPAKPSAAVIEKFANKIKAEFEAAVGIEEQMEIIMQQKYIHHNILNIYELWAELRRTRHPRIEKLKVLNVIASPIPERIQYPTSELRTNEKNFLEVVKENNFTTPIFWLPDNKKKESYYMDGYLPLKGFLPLPTPNPNRP